MHDVQSCDQHRPLRFAQELSSKKGNVNRDLAIKLANEDIDAIAQDGLEEEAEEGEAVRGPHADTATHTHTHTHTTGTGMGTRGGGLMLALQENFPAGHFAANGNQTIPNRIVGVLTKQRALEGMRSAPPRS